MVSTSEMLHWYVCGSVTKDLERHGLNAVRAKFDWAKVMLIHRCRGNKVYNPMNLCKPDWCWLRCMVKCLWTLITKCDAIYVLNDYKESRGAKIELWIAKLLKYKVLYE